MIRSVYNKIDDFFSALKKSVLEKKKKYRENFEIRKLFFISHHVIDEEIAQKPGLELNLIEYVDVGCNKGTTVLMLITLFVYTMFLFLFRYFSEFVSSIYAQVHILFSIVLRYNFRNNFILYSSLMIVDLVYGKCKLNSILTCRKIEIFGIVYRLLDCYIVHRH